MNTADRLDKRFKILPHKTKPVGKSPGMRLLIVEKAIAHRVKTSSSYEGQGWL